MERLPRISVITVCLNAAPMLEKTLKSVEAQHCGDIETIVVDGGSTDGTPQVMADYSHVIDKKISEKDNGIYDAMNKGVGMASGEWCIFLNAGDTFASHDTAKAVLEAVGDKAADVVYGGVVKPKPNGGGDFVKPAESPHNGHRMYFCHQSAFIKTSCLRQFPYDTKYTMSADFKLFKLLWKHNKTFLKLDFPVSVFDTGGVSNTNRAEGLRQNIAIIRELDGPADRLRLLPRLYFVLLMLRLRSKK